MPDDRRKLPTSLSVGEVAERAGVAVSALHFYEREGLIQSWRSAGNQRRYPRGVLRRVALIKTAQRLGLPLGRIADALANLPGDRPPTAADWRRLSASWREDLDARIAAMQALRDHWTAASDAVACHLTAARCAIRRISLANPVPGRGFSRKAKS